MTITKRKYTIAIITATKDEYSSIYNVCKELLIDFKTFNKSKNNPFPLFTGAYKNLLPEIDIEFSILTINSGFGKLNSVSAATILLSQFDIDLLINFGACGSLSSKLQIGDITLPYIIYESSYVAFLNQNKDNKLKSQDKDGKLKSFEQENKFINNTKIKNKYIISTGLNKKEKIIIDELFKNFNFLKKVTGYSSEMDVDSKEKKKLIRSFCNADICDWESFSIRKLSHLWKVPSIIIRVISDFADENFILDYKKNISNILQNGANILMKDILPISCKILISGLNL